MFRFGAVLFFLSWFKGIRKKKKKNELRGGMLWRILIADGIQKKMDGEGRNSLDEGQEIPTTEHPRPANL